jgi:hypothetical protein
LLLAIIGSLAALFSYRSYAMRAVAKAPTRAAR